jgi:hypothetical protein
MLDISLFFIQYICVLKLMVWFKSGFNIFVFSIAHSLFGHIQIKNWLTATISQFCIDLTVAIYFQFSLNIFLKD